MKQEKIFEFDQYLQLLAENILMKSNPHCFDSLGGEQRWHGPELMRLAENSITSETPKQFDDMARKNIHPAIAMYYLMMALRKIDPELFPPHDICLLFANLIQAQYDPSCLQLVGKGLFPAALLLASRGWEISLSPLRWFPGRQMRNLMQDVKFNMMPGIDAENILLSTSRRHMGLGRQGQTLMNNIRGAFFLETWNFLGVKSNEDMRRFWLEKNSLSCVLQLPRLKRQAWNYYSAILQSRNVPSREIRMVNIEQSKTGEASLNQTHALSLILDAANNKSSLDVSIDELKQDPICNLTPSIWLRKWNTPEIDGLRLGDCAQIIRCQLPRKKHKDLTSMEYGLQPDGSSIVREVGMAALQDESGFLLAESGDKVSINFKSEVMESKYCLKINDIIFSFRGTQESLGKVGFVDQKPEMNTISGPAFCIIRPNGKMDPRWLYWHLQSEQVRANILTRSSGKSLLNISTNDIKDLVIQQPKTQMELDWILEKHESISKEIISISNSIRELRRQIGQLKKVYRD